MPRRRRRTSVSYPRDAATDQRVRAVAESMQRRFDLGAARNRWQPLIPDVAALSRRVPTLSLDDYSRIPFVKSVPGVEWYQYRARLRAGEGDLYAVAAAPIDGYEEYNRAHLGLGATELVRLDRDAGGDLSLARRLLHEEEALRTIAQAARTGGGLRVHPYMGITEVWELARGIGEASGSPVHVLGPLPEVTRLVNDKGRFSEMVRELLGGEALAHTSISSDPAELADLLAAETRRSPTVALKMPSCASGMGNRLFDAARLRDRPVSDYRALVDRFLADKEWDGEEPVLVVEWHRNVLESPSTQCWIPPLGAGEPQVEEVFQQMLTGDEQVFQGAILSALPRRLRHRFMVQSWLLCRLFQCLGYVGRCSFDALIVGDDPGEATVRFVECNGRWGGTSTPMHLMKRVFGDFRTIPYRGQGYSDPRLKGGRFGDLLSIFQRHLYDRRTGRGRVLLYNPGSVTEHGKFDMVVTGRSYADIDRFVERSIPALIDRHVGSSQAAG